jgi:hypothetical protein
LPLLSRHVLSNTCPQVGRYPPIIGHSRILALPPLYLVDQRAQSVNDCGFAFFYSRDKLHVEKAESIVEANAVAEIYYSRKVDR